MPKVDKRYKIVFSNAGCKQQHQCQLDEDGNLIPSKLRISYFRGETPSLDNCKTVEDVLDVIKSVAYRNKAEIVSINGMPLNYYHNKEHREYVDSLNERLQKHIKSEAALFFNDILEPFLQINDWRISQSHVGIPILVAKNEYGKWDNINEKDEEYQSFEYLCDRFLAMVNEDDNKWGAFCGLQKYLDFKTYEKYYINDV